MFFEKVFAQATDAAPAAADGANNAAQQNPMFGMPLMIVAFGLIMYFMMIRPQQKRDKERRELLASITKGDRVITSGGIVGTVVGLNEKSVILRVSDDANVKMEFLRGAVVQVISRESEKGNE